MTPACMLAALLLAAPVPKVKPPILRVQAFEPNIVLGDPVDLQVDFVNTRTDAITTKNEIPYITVGSLYFELKSDGDEVFRKIYLSEYDTSAVPSRIYRVKYPPGSSCTHHLFVNRNDKGKLHFSSAGKWHLRAVIDASDGLIYSDSITITVSETTETRLEAIEKYKHEISIVLRFRGHAPVRYLATLKDVRTHFDKSYTGEVIENSLLVGDYLAATTPAARTVAREAIDRRLDKLPRGPRDQMAIDYAWALVERKEYDAARKVTETIRTKFQGLQGVEDAIGKQAEKSK